jgi:osmotically-inducible protein OsmY
MQQQYPILFVLIFTLATQGCAALVVGAGAGVAKVAHDRRTTGTQLDDTTTSARISRALDSIDSLEEQANINFEVYNRVVLLVGQAPDQELKNLVQKTVQSIRNVKKIHNQIRVTQPIALSSRTYDVWLASKIRTQLLAAEKLSTLHISVTVEDSEVFLMGLVNEQEAAQAVEIARNTNGVARVIKVFEDY